MTSDLRARFSAAASPANAADICEKLLSLRSEGPVVFVFGESHKGEAHERSLQEALITQAPAGTPIVIEAGSFGNSLAVVEDLARARGDLNVISAVTPDENCQQLMAKGELAEAFVFERSRAIFNAARDAATDAPCVIVFCGSGHLQGIEAAARHEKLSATLVPVNMADKALLKESTALESLMINDFQQMGFPADKAASEVTKMMATLSFAFQDKKTIQLGPT